MSFVVHSKKVFTNFSFVAMIVVLCNLADYFALISEWFSAASTHRSQTQADDEKGKCTLCC